MKLALSNLIRFFFGLSPLARGKVFFLHANSGKSTHYRAKLIKDYKTTKDDFILWIVEKVDEIEKSEGTSVVVTNCKII